MAVVALALLTTAAIARAGATLDAAGDGRDLWIVQREADGQSLGIFHRAWTDPADVLTPVRRDSGRIAPRGMATSGGTLWLVYDSLMVQSLRREVGTGGAGTGGAGQAGGEAVFVGKVEASLPRGVSLVSLAATADGPWALVRDAGSAKPQALPETRGDGKETVTGSDKPHALEGARGGSEGTGDEKLGGVEGEKLGGDVDRLLRLRGMSWVEVALPTDWPAGGEVGKDLVSPGNGWPVLVTRGGTELVVYRPVGEIAGSAKPQALDEKPGVEWRREVYPGAGAGAGTGAGADDPRPIFIGNQLIFGRVVGEADELRLAVELLRDGKALPLGELTLPINAKASPWTLVPSGQLAAAVAWLDKGKWTWSRLSLTGQVVTPASPLLEAKVDPMAKWSGQIVLLVVLVAATLIMFVFWRRDGGPMGVKLSLPKELALADLGTRALAGLIDLAPCVLAGMFVYGLNWRGMIAAWPGGPGSLWAIVPGAAVMGIFVLHTTLSEMFTGRSLGKMVMGLRVTDLSGKPINIWMALGRGLTKALDLIPPFPLLLLPLINPHRQRLGDLVARTVVVSDAVEKKAKDEGGAGDDE